MARENVNERDPKGAYGGDTGETDQQGKGPQAEKGDQRREGDDYTSENRAKGHRAGRTGKHAG
jgi:hypothetical protein